VETLLTTNIHSLPAPSAKVGASPRAALRRAFSHPGGAPAHLPLPLGGPLAEPAAVVDGPFSDPGLAAHHELGLEDGKAVLEGGGARVNGQAVHGRRVLEEGDVLRLGDAIYLYTCIRSPPVIDPSGLPALTGSTPSIEAVRRSIDAVAPHSRTVVVTGETGTGKEIVARLLHERSGRSGPFLAVNCGGFSEGLLASELFGHVRGAFTGAIAEQQGLFRAARGGTLLLDEASDIPLALQPILLRVLETWELRPVGSSRDVAIDVRVVAASNRELSTLVQRGLFRADLYARLAQWVIRLPPLRERRQDIPSLARAILARFDAADRTLTPDLEEALLIHPWPLNVRGLSNVLSIATIASPAGGPLHLGPEVLAALHDNLVAPSEAAEELPPPMELDRAGLEALLGRFRGRVAEMARHAGVSRPKMYRLLWAVDLDPATFRHPGAGGPEHDPGTP
jgi:transcriptional regulator of acetoin/glycerol metabolism